MVRPTRPSPYRYEILSTDTDERDELHGSSLFSFMQESAYRNAEHLGFGASTLDSRGLCWLLLKISVRLERLPAWDDVLEVHTWSRGAQRLLFLRDFQFALEGEPGFFGAASSEWLIGHAGTHRPQRPDTVFPNLLRPIVDRAVLPFACPKLAALPADVPPVLQKFADFSDIDRNRHVNNTRYIAWAIDALHAGTAEGPRHSLRGLDINYLSEVRFGEQIRISRQSVSAAALAGLPPEAVVPGTDAMLVEGHRHADGTPVFRCLIQYTPGCADNGSAEA